MFATIAGYIAAATLLILAPGPDSLLVVRNTLRSGYRTGLFTGAGVTTGLLVWAVAATLGLTALLQTSRVAFDVLRYAGACYLVWLGVRSLLTLRRRGAVGTTDEPAQPTQPISAYRAYLTGLVTNLANPKIGVFFLAFLPGFIPAGAPAALSSLAMGTWFAVETALWLAILSWLVVRGTGWLRSARAQRRLEGVTGVALVGFGVHLATSG